MVAFSAAMMAKSRSLPLIEANRYGGSVSSSTDEDNSTSEAAVAFFRIRLRLEGPSRLPPQSLRRLLTLTASEGPGFLTVAEGRGLWDGGGGSDVGT